MFRTMMMTIGVAFIGVSCGSDDTRDFDTLVTDFGTEVEAMRALNQGHAGAVHDASDLSAVHMLEDQHRSRMMDQITAMEQTMTRLGECEMSGFDGPRMMEGISQDLDQHWNAMHGATSIQAAHQEETRYQEHMTDALGGMDQDHHHMMGMMGTQMRCGPQS